MCFLSCPFLASFIANTGIARIQVARTSDMTTYCIPDSYMLTCYCTVFWLTEIDLFIIARLFIDIFASLEGLHDSSRPFAHRHVGSGFSYISPSSSKPKTFLNLHVFITTHPLSHHRLLEFVFDF